MLYNQNDNNDIANAAFTKSKMNCYNKLKEIRGLEDGHAVAMAGSLIKDGIALIYAGVGRGFKNIQELHVM